MTSMFDSLNDYKWPGPKHWQQPIGLPLASAYANYLILTSDGFSKHPGWSVTLIVMTAGYHILACADCALRKKVSPFRLVKLLSASATFLMFAITGFAVLYKRFGVVDSQGVTHSGSLDCLYFSLITWTTVGYGDLVPSPPARMIAASEAMLGYIFMGLFLSASFQLLVRLNEQAKDGEGSAKAGVK
jgi:hypothetical protein